MPNLTYPFTPMPLKYRFNELEPYLNEQVVFTHYEKHYKSYIDKLKRFEHVSPIPLDLVRFALNIYQPLGNQNQVWVSAGGVYNHELYFATMTPNYRPIKDELFQKAVNTYFGSLQGFEELFKRLTSEFVGSGYVSFINLGELRLMTTFNQILFPTVCFHFDHRFVEHSYYLHTKQPKDYVNAWFNLIDWEEVSKRYRQPFFR